MAESGTEVNGALNPAVEDLIKHIALIINNSAVYGFSHSVTRQAVPAAFNTLNELLREAGELTLASAEDGLLVNGKALDRKAPAVNALARRLRSLDMSNFTLVSGLTAGEFDDLLEILSARPEQIEALGGTVKLVEMAAFEHVRVQKVAYLAVSEEQLVVSADEVAETESEADGAKDAVGRYIGSDESEVDSNTAAGVKELAGRPQTLADLILDAAGIHVAPKDAEAGRALAERIVRCLRKVYDALKQDPSFATQRGKKDATKSLKEIGDHIRGELREKMPAVDEHQGASIDGAINEMAEETRVESLAAEYVRKRKAILQNEERILRFIRSRGLDAIVASGLGERLQEYGLPPEEWSALAARAGGETTLASRGGGAPVPGRLGAMLAGLEESGSGALENEGVEDLVSMLEEIEREVTAVADETDGRIENLVDRVQADSARLAGEPEAEPEMPRDKLIETMAEIVQELCQPVSVINCSIGMVLSRNLGEVAKAQHEALELACVSSERLNRMIARLSKISGVPASLAPDKSIQDALLGSDDEDPETC